MRILGIDPGTVVMGYGIVESNGGDFVLVDYGVIKPPSKLKSPERLGYIYGEIFKVIARYKPDAVAIEEPFVSENIKSALAIGKAQAIAILAAVNNKIPIHEYPPSRIKQQVTGYGGGTKEQVQEMVRLQLNLSGVPSPFDAADALAVAICHIQESRLNSIISSKSERAR